VCEIGHWVGFGGVTYQDKYGDIYTADKAVVIANREQVEDDTCMDREVERQRAERSRELTRRAESPMTSDPILEQPESLDPISMNNIRISNNRAFWRPWRDHTPFWTPHEWTPIPDTAHRVAVVQERMWRVAYHRKSDDGIIIWTMPLRRHQLSKTELKGAIERMDLDPTVAATCPWDIQTGSFSRDRTQWWDRERRTFVRVKRELKAIGVPSAIFWRVVYRDFGQDGRPCSMVSIPMNWAYLTQGEQATFQHRPLNIDVFNQS
jgi:hypothetical protein